MAEGRLLAYKEVVPKHLKTAPPAVVIIARIPTSRPPAKAVEAVVAVCVAAVTAAKAWLPDRLPELLHIHIIQHADRAIT
jgi:hypothetical protein